MNIEDAARQLGRQLIPHNKYVYSVGVGRLDDNSLAIFVYVGRKAAASDVPDEFEGCRVEVRYMRGRPLMLALTKEGR